MLLSLILCVLLHQGTAFESIISAAHSFGPSCWHAVCPNKVGNFSMSNSKNRQAATIGSLVKLRERGENDEEVYRLGKATRPLDNELAPDNPMGKALIGAAPGDQITVEGPKGPIEFDILEVRHDEGA